MRIIHVGSLFIGLQNLGKSTDNSYMFSQVQDYFDYLSFIAEYVDKNSIDVVLFSGNLFFSSHPSPFLQWKLGNVLEKMHKSDIKIFILQNQYDQSDSYSSSSEICSYSMLDKYARFVNKPSVHPIKRKKDSIQIAFLPFKRSPFSTDSKNLGSNKTKEFEKELKILSSQIDSDIPSFLMTQALIDNVKQYYLFNSLPEISSSISDSLPFHYISLSNFPFSKIIPVHRRNNQTVFYSYPGTLGEIEFEDSLIDRGFILYDTKNNNSPVFVPNAAKRHTALIRVHGQNEEEVWEKLNEEFLLNDYRDYITTIVVQAPLRINPNVIRDKYSEHCYYIQRIVSQKEIVKCEETYNQIGFSDFLRSYLTLQDIQDKDFLEDVYKQGNQYYEKTKL